MPTRVPVPLLRTGRGTAMVAQVGLKRCKAREAFTLVELLLAVVLVVLLLGALALNFSTLHHGAELQEGTVQFESLLRFARAYAANSGRQVQIRIGPASDLASPKTSGFLRVVWEPDPVSQPGKFQDLRDAELYIRSVTDLVRAERPPSAESLTDDGERLGEPLE